MVSFILYFYLIQSDISASVFETSNHLKIMNINYHLPIISQTQPEVDYSSTDNASILALGSFHNRFVQNSPSQKISRKKKTQNSTSQQRSQSNKSLSSSPQLTASHSEVKVREHVRRKPKNSEVKVREHIRRKPKKFSPIDEIESFFSMNIPEKTKPTMDIESFKTILSIQKESIQHFKEKNRANPDPIRAETKQAWDVFMRSTKKNMMVTKKKIAAGKRKAKKEAKLRKKREIENWLALRKRIDNEADFPTQRDLDTYCTTDMPHGAEDYI